MNNRIRSLFIVGLTMAAGAAYADGHVRVDINPFGWGEPPPVVYESPRYYAPPPVVYQGRGHYWASVAKGATAIITIAAVGNGNTMTMVIVDADIESRRG